MILPASYIVLMFHVATLVGVLGVRRGSALQLPFGFYCSSNTIFQPQLLIICDVNLNPGPVSKRNQARPTAPTRPVCEKAVA